jgi:hypothetical protein
LHGAGVSRPHLTSPPFCCSSLHVRCLHTRGPSTRRRSRGTSNRHAPSGFAQSLGTLHALLLTHLAAHSVLPQSTSVSRLSRLQLAHDSHVAHGPPHARQAPPSSLSRSERRDHRLRRAGTACWTLVRRVSAAEALADAPVLVAAATVSADATTSKRRPHRWTVPQASPHSQFSTQRGLNNGKRGRAHSSAPKALPS